MNEDNPFSLENLEWIFHNVDDKVVRRESTTVEFKENFNFNSLPEYGKIGSSFANRNGGYVVFGIKDRPHLMLGMQNDQFINLNIERATAQFNEYFTPSIKCDFRVHELDEKKYGLIYFYESSNKPIISVKNNNHGKFSEGEIYYRYSGQTRKIRYSELNEIIVNKINKEKKDWLDFLKNAMRFNPESALILDLDSGTINSNNRSILIDEKSLDKLKFIKEGEFSEIEGAPTLKLIGEINASAKMVEKRVVKPIAITTEQLLESFFNQNCENPTEYLKQLCYESAMYLPMWYFIFCSRKSIDEIDSFWKSLNDVKEATRKKLFQRLTEDNVESYNIGKLIDFEDEVEISNIEMFNKFVTDTRLKLKYSSKRDITIKRSSFYKVIISNNEQYLSDDFINSNPRPLFEAISHLPTEIVIEKKEWILKVLSTIHSSKLSSNFVSSYRKSICSVDIKLSKSQID
jgi:ribosomal protein L24